jgi:hypothetical protein
MYCELKRRHPGAFAGRVEAARRERPRRWKRVTYPLLFGPRLLVPRTRRVCAHEDRCMASPANIAPMTSPVEPLAHV